MIKMHFNLGLKETVYDCFYLNKEGKVAEFSEQSSQLFLLATGVY